MRVDFGKKGPAPGTANQLAIQAKTRAPGTVTPEAKEAAEAKQRVAGIMGTRAVKRTAFGWHDKIAGHWCLSKFGSDVNFRPYNRYASKKEAQTHAEQRGLTITWEDEAT